MLYWYFRISIFISFALVAIYLTSMQGPFSLASDGSGPDGNALLAFGVQILAVLMLVQSAVTGLFLLAKHKKEAQIGLTILFASGFALLFPQLKSFAQAKMSDYRYQSAPETKMRHAIQSGSVSEFFQYYDRLQSQQGNPSFRKDLLYDLVSAGRLEILEALKNKGVALIEAQDEEAWASAVAGAVASEKIKSPEARLKLVQWLFDQGFVSRYSKSQRANAFSSLGPAGGEYQCARAFSSFVVRSTISTQRASAIFDREWNRAQCCRGKFREHGFG
jgi:hypothetical protein